MSSIKRFGKLLRTSNLSEIQYGPRLISVQNIPAVTGKIEKSTVLPDNKNEDLTDKSKNENYLHLKDEEKICMRDPPNRCSLYTEYRDDSDLVKHIEVLQRFADRYNEGIKDVGPIETDEKIKPKSDNKVKDIKIWDKTSKKHFSTMSSNFNQNEPKFKSNRVFITLENEPPMNDARLPKQILKKPILLYSIGLENGRKGKKLPKKPKPFVPISMKDIKEAVKKADKIKKLSSGDNKISSFKDEVLCAVVHTSEGNNVIKRKLPPDHYKRASVLIRNFTTNKDKKFVISQAKTGTNNNSDGIRVRTLMREAENIPKINDIKVNRIYKEKEKKKTLKECLIANKDLEKNPNSVKSPVRKSELDTMKILNELNTKKNPDKITKNLTKCLVAERKAKISTRCEEELKPKVFCRTSLSVKPSDLPITKCKRMIQSEGYQASSGVNVSEKSLQVRPCKTQLELHECSKLKDESFIKRLITFFKK